MTTCELYAIEQELAVSLTISDLEAAIGREMQAIFDGIMETIRLAELRPGQVQKVFTTGGSTAIPAIGRWLRTNLSSAEIVEGDRFGSVGMGLALEAQRRFS
jgi:hypothetical chaperone protein